MKFANRHIKLLFYSYTVILILISVLPINSSGSSINHIFVVSIRLDYLLHFAIFIPWVFLLQKITQLNLRSVPAKTLGWLVVGVLFALSTEAIQYLLPYRAFNINDLLANGFGVILGFVFFISYWSVVGSSPLGERGVRKAIKKS
jgi:glycopeptide antibiotics resistance protein